ncbi:hypothetical protein Tco_0194380 [Tanacetum coccineum]
MDDKPIEPDQEGLISNDNLNDPLLELPEFESFHFDPSFPRPPPEPPDVEICLYFEPDAPVIDNFNELNDDQRGSEIDFSQNVEDDDSFTFVIRTFLPFLTYPEDVPDFEDSRAHGTDIKEKNKIKTKPSMGMERVRENESNGIDDAECDPEKDILLLEAILNSEPSSPLPNHANYFPEVRKELKNCEAKTDGTSIDEPSEAELKGLLPISEYAVLEGDTMLSTPPNHEGGGSIYDIFTSRDLEFILVLSYLHQGKRGTDIQEKNKKKANSKQIRARNGKDKVKSQAK